jgi:hypothetical protein
VRHLLLLPIAFALTLPGCGGHACTEVGCSDGLVVQVRRPTSEWAPGAYGLELAFDGHAITCAFTLPADFPATGSVKEIPCQGSVGAPGFSVILDQDSICDTVQRGGSETFVCQPVPNRYSLRAGLYGTPATAKLVLGLDDGVLLDTELTPTYEESRPNGPDCGPVCRQATVDLELR